QVELFGLPDPERLAVELLRRLPPETDFERRWCETRRALEQAEAVTSKRSLHEHYWKVALREADGDEEHAAWLVERAITDDEFAAAETAEQALPLRRGRRRETPHRSQALARRGCARHEVRPVGCRLRASLSRPSLSDRVRR